MKRYVQNLAKLKLVATLALLFIVAYNSLLVQAKPVIVTADTDGIDEIVVVGTDGFVYVYDYNGEEVYRSPQGGWEHVATADLNNDNDEEIIAVGLNTIKVYDPQILNNAEYTFSATYNGSSGQFIKVGTGNLIASDDAPEIALLRSVGDGSGRVVVYDPPNTTPVKDQSFITDWDDFAIGDYDGDEDDDFALIYWNDSFPSGQKNWLELRQGHDPIQKLDGSNNAGIYSDSEWFDVAAGNFVTTNGEKVEWVGSQNLDDNIIVQRWSNQDITTVWSQREGAFEFLATADFRAENVDQVVMLRNVTGNSVSMRFVNHQGITWAELSNLGTGWLNLAAGNVDADSVYREAVILRGNLIRIYRLAQSSAAAMDCDVDNECLEISGSFKGALALGDLGVDFDQLIPYEVRPPQIERTALQNEGVVPGKIFIYGEKGFRQPLTWGATMLPSLGSAIFRKALEADKDLSFTITSEGIRYQSEEGMVEVPSVPWMSLSSYTGTTPATVTVTFSDTVAGSPIFAEDIYQATILVWQTDLPDDRFRYSDVTVIVGVGNIYLPIILSDE